MAIFRGWHHRHRRRCYVSIQWIDVDADEINDFSGAFDWTNLLKKITLCASNQTPCSSRPQSANVPNWNSLYYYIFFPEKIEKIKIDIYMLSALTVGCVKWLCSAAQIILSDEPSSLEALSKKNQKWEKPLQFYVSSVLMFMKRFFTAHSGNRSTLSLAFTLMSACRVANTIRLFHWTWQ